MKGLKLFVKRIVVVYLILFLILANTSTCRARPYDAACGEYVSNYAKEFIAKYGSNSVYVATAEVSWAGGSFGNGTFYCCCTSGVKYMFEQALGINLYNYGYSAWASDNLSITSTYWDINPVSAAMPGDIYVKHGHVELATGGGGTANFGSSGPAARVTTEGGRFEKSIRLKNNVDVNPSGVVGGASSSSNYDEEKDSIYGSNGFVYQGVATLSGYESGGTLGKWLFDTLLKILDWIIGLLTYILRMVIVGWTIIVERVFIDGIVNSITGINNTSGDDGDDEEPEPVGDESNPDEYVSSGMVGISNIGDNAKLNSASNSKNSSKANVTVENIVYNRVPILDANFFNFETAVTVENNEGNLFRPGTLIGNDGEGMKIVTTKIEKGGILYILKLAIATWYYTFRVIAIAIMLVILIYLGIKSAFSSVADGKALYKEMLLGWVTGFILLFLMHYIMYITLYLNEGVVSIIAQMQKILSGQEISLYETVRTKAYEIKASTGWSGAIMYIILVYYAVKFLLIYTKRYFTLALLAVLSPFVALSYALEKINKKGKRAAIYGTWLRDFIFTTMLQSVHALIYAIFIGTALKLTEASLMGIALSLVFLHFMVHAEEILRKIMAFPEGPSQLMQTTIPTLAVLGSAKIGGTSVKKIGSAYGKAMNKVVLKPVSKAAGKTMDLVKGGVERVTGQENNFKTLSDVSTKKSEEVQKKKEQTRKEVMAALGTAKDIGAGLIYGVAVIPAIVISGTELGSIMFQKSMLSFLNIKANKTIDIKGVQKKPKYNRLKFNGVALRSDAAARRLMAKLDAAGIKYTTRNGMIKAGATMRERKELLDEYGEGLVEPKGNILTRTLRLAGRLGKGAAYVGAGGALVDGIKNADKNFPGREDEARRAAVIRVYSEAERRENEIIREYQQIKVDQEKLLAVLEEKNPALADRLRRRQASEMEETMYALAEPITMEDIEEAIAHYTERNPQFDVEAAALPTDENLVGVVQELNEVLDKKHSRVRAGDNFVQVLKTNLYAAQAGIAGAGEEEAPVDRMSGVKATRPATGKGRVDPRTGAEEFDPNDPMQSRNAPSQGGAKENAEDLDARAAGVAREVGAEAKRVNKSSSSASSAGVRYNARLAREEIDRNDPMQSRNAPTQGSAKENGGTLKDAIKRTATAAGTIEVKSDVDTGSLGSLIGKILELQSINDELVALGEEPIYDPMAIIKELNLM